MNPKQIHVLLLEDEAAHAEAIRRAVESSDNAFQVQVVGTLNEFRDCVKINPPDIALLDMVLPDGNGIDLLKSLPQPSAFPMLILTSHGSENAAVEALKAGALDYIVKSPETFIETPRILTRNLNQWALIQENKKIEQALHLSEANFHNSMENSPLGIRIVSENGETLYTNRAFLNIYGYMSKGEFNATPVKDRYTPESYTEFRERRDQRRRRETLPDNYEISIVRKNGTVRHLQVMRKEILWAGKQQYQTIYRDVTEHKQAEEALRTSEERYRLIVEKSNDVLFTFNIAGEFSYISPSVKNVLGYNPSDLIGRSLISLVHPEDVLQIQQVIQRNIKEGYQTPGGNELRLRHVSGEWRWHNVSGNAVYDTHGKFINFVGISRDITERKLMDMKLDELHKTMQLVTEINELIVKIDNEDELLQRACNRFVESKQYPLAWVGFKKEGSFDILPFVQCGERADYLAAVNITWDDSPFGSGPTGIAVKTGKPDIIQDMVHDLRYGPWKEKALKYGFKASAAFPLIIQDNVIGVLNIYSASVESFNKDEVSLLEELAADLSLGIEKIRRREEQRKLEEALNLSEQNFRNSLDSSIMGMRIIDTEGQTLYANQAFLDMFGYKKYYEVGRYALQDHYTPEEKARYIERMARKQRGESIPDNSKVDILYKNGAVRSIVIYSGDVLWNGKSERQLVYYDITARQQAEEALKISEQNFRNSIDRSTIGIRIVDTAWHTLYANQVFLDIFGYKTVAEIGLVNPRELYTDREYALFLERHEKRRRGESVSDDIEMEIIRKDGAVRYVQSSRSDVLWNGLPAYQLFCIDVTERVQAEEALKLSEQNFRNSLDSSLIGIRIVDEDGRNLYLNRTFLNLFGYKDAAEVEASPPQEHYTPECHAEYLRRGERIAHGEPIPEYYEIDIIRKDGAVRHLQLFRKLVLWNGKQEFQILYNDITERVQAEETLKASEEKYSTLIEQSSDGILILVDRMIVFANRRVNEMTGFAQIEILGKYFYDLAAPEYREKLEEINRKRKVGMALEANQELQLLTKDGTRVAVETKLQPIVYEGKPAGMVIVHDITERIQAEASLKLSEQNFRNTLDSSLMGIFIGHSGRVLYVNKAFLEMFGYDNIDEVTATRPVKFYSPESYDQYLKHKEQQKHGELEEDKFEIEIIRKDGSRRHLQAYRQKVLWDNKLRSQIIYNDVTALKQAEEERQKFEDKAQVASRLAVVGEMAAGVAHEINNPLTGVLGFSQMLLEKENVPDEIKAELRLIVDGSQRVADIVKRLLTFARQTKPVKTMTNINELIDNTLKLREYVLKTVNINVVTRFDPELPWSVADPGQLQQVFLNVIVNAEQAMKVAHGRGTLTITTEPKENNIRISFQDDGPGIAPENLKRLFEPFFTTKAPGEGTGLGLSLSRSIILEHNGSMSVESEFGQGANFIIELPIIESLPSAPDILLPPEKTKLTATAHGKILVVDDESGVRILLERVFTQMGHQVETVADAETAVKRLDSGVSYDVILTDVRMPGMSGIELNSYILMKTPEMKNKIIFITGDVMGADIKEFLMKNNLTYFAKPFDIEALKGKIDSLMMTVPPPNGGTKRSTR
jgi:PAS domain S-box-containing protein